MVTHEWDPVAYGRFAQERRRPFDDLMARVGAIRPRTVVDLGCGSGEMTIELAGGGRPRGWWASTPRRR
ncbi:hypothetical protein [Mobilicoccus caccae]